MERPISSARISKLPEEIRETQKSRSDLLKWKLVLVAILGATGFGLMDKASPVPILLALIPLVCLYVDLLCTHFNLRQIVIGAFFRTVQRDAYESFVQINRKAFTLEDWALYWSTIAACAVVALTGGCMLSAAGFLISNSPWDRLVPGVLIGAGVLGILISLLTRRRFRSMTRLRTLPVDLFFTLAVKNRSLSSHLRPLYTSRELVSLHQFLTEKGTFLFRSLPNGLFPAAGAARSGDASGYQYAWVRDNVHIAHAHYACGDVRIAVRAAEALLDYFRKHAHRFTDIVEGRKDPVNPMNRPHVRFQGETLAELQQKWPHAQNDALGYFLWFYCKLARADQVPCGLRELECLELFPLYFRKIEYWHDEDSGHWEEGNKVSASSIGTVIAGLRELESLLTKPGPGQDFARGRSSLDLSMLRELRAKGQRALEEILPCETIYPLSQYRRYDSALLFLFYPLEILDRGTWARQILEDITTHLQGEHGIRRYLGDSYWFPNYKDEMVPEARTGDFSETIRVRDALARGGEEAQWCLFDPIISVIHGQRFQDFWEKRDRTQADEALLLQTHYFNRALSHLTDRLGDFPECSAPEAYYLKKGLYVPNDHTPLLWTQANLWLALKCMQKSTRNVE